MFARVSTCLCMSYDVSSEEATLVCSNCGYENPRDHRYCGMCGTPFPHRSLTVPTAQSTLSFTSTPLEIQAPVAPGIVTHETLKIPPAEQVASALSKAEPAPDVP